MVRGTGIQGNTPVGNDGSNTQDVVAFLGNNGQVSLDLTGGGKTPSGTTIAEMPGVQPQVQDHGNNQFTVTVPVKATGPADNFSGDFDWKDGVKASFTNQFPNTTVTVVDLQPVQPLTLSLRFLTLTGNAILTIDYTVA